MYGQSTTGTTTITQSGDRMLQLEVTGLLNPVGSLATSDKVQQSTQTIKVAYSRLLEEMQRVQRMGGKITNVTTL